MRQSRRDFLATESKIITYLGFCIKSGKIAFGLDNAEKKKKIFLLLYDRSLSDNSTKQAQKLAAKQKCDVLVYGQSLGGLLHRDGCKLVAVTDQSLANAIRSAADGQENFCLLQGVGGNS